MARRINQKCQHCATLSIEEAIALHGPVGEASTLSQKEAIARYGRKGEGCWNPNTCHRKRSHYRHRDDNNRIRRRQRRNSQNQISQEQSGPVQEYAAPIQAIATDPDSYFELSLPPATTYAAVLVLYRNRKDSPVHAVGAEIWQGDTKVLNIKAIHCSGMRGNEVADYIEKMLAQLHAQFGVSRFEAEPKERPVADCPLTPCPLKSS